MVDSQRCIEKGIENFQHSFTLRGGMIKDQISKQEKRILGTILTLSRWLKGILISQ